MLETSVKSSTVWAQPRLDRQQGRGTPGLLLFPGPVDGGRVVPVLVSSRRDDAQLSPSPPAADSAEEMEMPDPAAAVPGKDFTHIARTLPATR